MKALRFEEFGELNQLHLEELPSVTAAPGEVIVGVRAASLNPSDVKNVMGRMEGTTLPRTPGRDFAGIVIQGPDHLIGRQVWGSGGDIGFTRDGSHAEQIVVPAEGVALKPTILSMEEAASVGVNFVTAWLGLEALSLNNTDTLIVTGAGGGVGSAVIQLAKWRGSRVIAVDRHTDFEERAKENGADLALALPSEPLTEFPSMVRAQNHGKGVTAVFDCVGGPLFEACLRSLDSDGRQVNITSVGDRRIGFDLVDFYHRRLTLRGVDSRSVDTVHCAGILNLLRPGFESAALRPPYVSLRSSLSEAIKAYKLVHDGALQGKAVFVVDDPGSRGE